MYPHSREYRGIFAKDKFQIVITAEFELPIQITNNKDGIRLLPVNYKRHTYPLQCDFDNSFNFHVSSAVQRPKLMIRLARGGSTWKLDISYAWLQSLAPQNSFMTGSVHFRSKLFGNWEPFEFVRYFVVERSERFDNQTRRFVQPLFPVELLGKDQLSSTLEMTLKLEYIFVNESDKVETELMKHRAEMNNALVPTLPKSDLRIKLGDEEFFVHMKHIKAFSAVSEALSKYVEGSNWDWSDMMTPDSMRALLRYIYYDAVDSINNPKVTFHLLQFSHMYQAECLFKICAQKLLHFSDGEFKFPDIFEMYLFVRISDEFQKLKNHFCGVLFRNASKYNSNELKALAQGYGSGVGVEALVEILQF